MHAENVRDVPSGIVPKTLGEPSEAAGEHNEANCAFLHSNVSFPEVAEQKDVRIVAHDEHSGGDSDGIVVAFAELKRTLVSEATEKE